MINIDPRLKEYLSGAKETIAARAEEGYQCRFDYVNKRCQSPIESLLLAALIKELDEGGGLSFMLPGMEFCPSGLDYGKNRQTFPGIHLYVQAAVGRYVADFMIEVVVDRSHVAARFVVESDGHEFHEKNKRQAAHDKRRDRDLMADGCLVLRFTGSEIWRDPDRCAESVIEIIENTMNRMSVAA